MYLEELIEFLENEKPSRITTVSFKNPHSYRGIYEDLAFELDDRDGTVGEMLDTVKSAEGQTFEGWKGGDFTMRGYCDVWIADKGTSEGQKIGRLLMEYIVGRR